MMRCAFVIFICCLVSCKGTPRNVRWVVGDLPIEVRVDADGTVATWKDGHTAKYPKGQFVVFSRDGTMKDVVAGGVK